MKISDCIYGFELKKITNLPEIDSVFYEMEHRATGARLGWLQNGDDNKTFSITFCTTPKDNTGVFHILEHSVLQGSHNYPAKAPFVHLMKSSMNTFLNAMTFPDKTMFPVSSRSEKDFENLLRVYMDAVLHPMVHENENIFLQEGWHYEIEDGVPYCNGVVLNEMKGDHSSVDSLLATYTAKQLFPDNCYSYESGGDPEAIVTLSYSDFCAAHRKYYHPSNAFILLDGNVNLERTLHILDEEFLGDYSKSSDCFTVPLQTPVQSSAEYEFAAEDEEDLSGYLGLSYVIASTDEPKKLYAARILADYLAGTNASPLKRALLERELCGDVTVSLMEEYRQQAVLLTIRNMDPSKRDELEEIIREELIRIRQTGLDTEQLEALLCQQEFQARERDYGEDPSGVMNGINILATWLYGGNPVQCFQTKDMFAELHQEIENGTFASYLEEFFIRNPHTASILMKPSVTYLEEQDQRENARLEAIFSKMTDEERTAISAKEQQLKEWQSAPDTDEILKCIPVLNIEDLSKDPIAIHSHALPDGTLWHRETTNGISYLRLYFPIPAELESSMSALSFTTGLYGELPLLHMDKNKLDCEKNRRLGHLGVYLDYITSVVSEESRVYMRVDISYLAEREAEAIELALEILAETDFDASDEIAELLYQQQELAEQELIMNGHSMAMMEAKSHISKNGALMNLAEGPAYIEWVTNQVAALEASRAIDPEDTNTCNSSSLQDLQNTCKKISKAILCPDNLFVSMTSDDKEAPYANRIKELLRKELTSVDTEITSKEKFASMSADLSNNAADSKIVDSAKPSFISIPAPIAYSSMVGNLNQQNIENSGSWSVLAKLVSMDYLWNEVRVLGGAYGTGMSVDADGTVTYFSYRDPNPKNSLATYRKVPEFISEFCQKESDLTGVIIGAISDTEPVLTAGNKGYVADKWYLSDITDEYRIERRNQMLHTTMNDFRKFGENLQALESDMRSCIVASPEMMEE